MWLEEEDWHTNGEHVWFCLIELVIMMTSSTSSVPLIGGIGWPMLERVVNMETMGSFKPLRSSLSIHLRRGKRKLWLDSHDI